MTQINLYPTLVGQFHTFLDPQNIALRSQTTAVNAGRAITILSRRRDYLAQHQAATSATEEEKLQRYIKGTSSALSEAKTKIGTVATYLGIDVQQLRRILNTIEVALHVFFGAHDKTGTLANVWTMLDHEHQAPTRNDKVWATDTLQYACGLSRAVVDMTKAQPWGPSLLMVKRRDIETAASSAFLLAHAIRAHHYSLGFAIPANHQDDQGASYAGEFDQRQPPVRPASAPRIVFTMPPLHYRNATEAQKWADQSLRTYPVPAIPQTPHDMSAARGNAARKHAASHSTGKAPPHKKTKTATVAASPLWKPYVLETVDHDKTPSDVQNQASDAAATSKTMAMSNIVNDYTASVQPEQSNNEGK